MLGSGGCSGRTPVFVHISFQGAANERPQFTPLEPDAHRREASNRQRRMPKVQLNKAKRAARRVVDAPNSPVTAPVAEARPQHVARGSSSWEREGLPIWLHILPSQPPRLQELGRRSTIFAPSPCLLTITADGSPNC